MFTRVCCILALGLVSARAEEAVYVFSTLAGSPGAAGDNDGAGAAARFKLPAGIAVDNNGNVFVVDDGNGTIRKITSAGVVSTIAGRAGNFGNMDGTAIAARFSRSASLSTSQGAGVLSPTILQDFGKGLAIAPDATLYVTDTQNGVVRAVSGGTVTTLAHPKEGPVRLSAPLGIWVDQNLTIVVADHGDRRIKRITLDGVLATVAGAGAAFPAPTGGTIAPPGTIISGPPPISADGDATTARFTRLNGVAGDLAGNVYVVDQTWSGAIRRISKDGSVTTIAGSLEYGSEGFKDGSGGEARFKRPRGIARDIDGTFVVADTENRRIRRVTPDGVVTTIAGSSSGTTDGVGTDALFITPFGVAVDPAGNLYVSDPDAHTIRKGLRVVKPVVSSISLSQPATRGQTITLRVDAASAVAPSFQWSKDGSPIAGATSATLVLSNVTDAAAGNYAVTISNPAGAVTSAAIAITFGQLPAITKQPVGQSLRGGQPLTLTVDAAGGVATQFQWQRNGVDIAGATNATFTVANVQAEHAGTYRAIATNAAGSTTSAAVEVTVDTSRIVNLSIRTTLAADAEGLVLGFVVSGRDKLLLARGVGPTLKGFGVGAALADPRITVVRDGTTIATNDDWDAGTGAAEAATAAQSVGAFPLANGTADAALLTRFDTGGYSALINGKGAGGVVLIELYDANPATEGRMINVSTRAQVGTGEDVLIAGFVIAGNKSKTVLVRAVGPTLAGFGVPGVLTNPRLEVRSSALEEPVASNDDWGGGRALVDAFAAQGAFPFAASDSKDAAVLVTLPPGSYSVQVAGVGGTTGEALLEIYEVF